MVKYIAVCVILCAACFAQTPYPVVGQTGYQPMGLMPSSSTAIVSTTVLGGTLYLANTSASSVTVTLTDQSTACGGAACSFWPAISLSANQVYVAQLNGIVIVGGIKWSASAGSAVVGYISYQYPANIVAGSFSIIPAWYALGACSATAVVTAGQIYADYFNLTAAAGY